LIIKWVVSNYTKIIKGVGDPPYATENLDQFNENNMYVYLIINCLTKKKREEILSRVRPKKLFLDFFINQTFEPNFLFSLGQFLFPDHAGFK